MKIKRLVTLGSPNGQMSQEMRVVQQGNSIPAGGRQMRFEI